MGLRYSEEYELFCGEAGGLRAQHWPRPGEQAKLDFDQQTVLFRHRAIDAGHVLPRRRGNLRPEKGR